MSGRDPDLPILEELGAEFTAMVESAYAAEGHGVRRRASLPKRERGAQARRMAGLVVAHRAGGHGS